jgi:hypothetical protein
MSLCLIWSFSLSVSSLSMSNITSFQSIKKFKRSCYDALMVLEINFIAFGTSDQALRQHNYTPGTSPSLSMIACAYGRKILVGHITWPTGTTIEGTPAGTSTLWLCVISWVGNTILTLITFKHKNKIMLLLLTSHWQIFNNEDRKKYDDAKSI